MDAPSASLCDVTSPARSRAASLTPARSRSNTAACERDDDSSRACASTASASDECAAAVAGAVTGAAAVVDDEGALADAVAAFTTLASGCRRSDVCVDAAAAAGGALIRAGRANSVGPSSSASATGASAFDACDGRGGSCVGDDARSDAANSATAADAVAAASVIASIALRSCARACSWARESEKCEACGGDRDAARHECVVVGGGGSGGTRRPRASAARPCRMSESVSPSSRWRRARSCRLRDDDDDDDENGASADAGGGGAAAGSGAGAVASGDDDLDDSRDDDGGDKRRECEKVGDGARACDCVNVAVGAPPWPERECRNSAGEYARA